MDYIDKRILNTAKRYTDTKVGGGAWSLFPDRGALVGINVETIGGSGLTYDQTIAAHERDILGHPADIIHNYHWVGTAFPNAQELARTKAGQTILVSVQSQNGSGVIAWADVAAGTQDAAIDAYADGVKSLAPAKVWVNFENEPDLQTTVSGSVAVGVTNTDGFVAKGTPQEFCAAYKRFVDRFRARGVTNAVFTNIYAGIATTNKQNIVLACWPGAGYVDVIGYDPYTRVGDAGGLKTFAAMAGPWYDWAIANLTGASKIPFILAEYGAEEHASDALWKYRWFLSIADAIESGAYPNIKGLCYFDHTSTGSGVWNIKSSAQSRAGYRELARRIWNPTAQPLDPDAEVYRTGDYHYSGPNGSVSTSNTLNNGELRVSPLDVVHPLPLAAIGATITAAGTAGCTYRLGIYADDGTGTFPGALVLDAGTVAGDAIAVPEITGLTTYLKPGRYWVGGVLQGSPASQPTVRTNSNALGRVTRIGSSAPSSSTSVPIVGWRTSSVTGALPATFPTAGANQPGTTPLVHFKVG